MAWWFVAPLVIWGAKKIYDEVTEDDSPSYSSESSSTVSSAKSTRTKTRRSKVRELITKNRLILLGELKDNLNGVVLINECSEYKYDIDFYTVNRELDELSRLRELFTGISLGTDHSISELHFTDVVVVVNEVIDKANREYGDMAGINFYNEYVESEDPFLNKISLFFV